MKEPITLKRYRCNRPTCRHTYKRRDSKERYCPKCKGFDVLLVEIKAAGYNCKRCDHSWEGKPAVSNRPTQPPMVCPKCHSPWWKTPRPDKKKQQAH